MPKLTIRAIRYGRTYGKTDPDYRTASFLKIFKSSFSKFAIFKILTKYLKIQLAVKWLTA